MKVDEKVSELVKEFETTISEAEEKEELIKSFEEYLNRLKNYAIEKNKEKEYIINFLEYTAENANKMPLLHKKQKLINDESYNHIYRLSMQAYAMTRDVICSKKIEVDEENIENMRKELLSELDNVREFNRDRAEWLVSEGVLDLKFIQNPNPSIMSFRLGRHYVHKKS